MLRTITLSVLSALLLLSSVACDREPRVPAVPRIAHAGGGYAGETYTNSLEALKANRDRFDAFEVDFVFTSDGELVCLHDWEKTSERIFGRSFSTPPDLTEFEAMAKAHPRFTSCTLDSLRQWLEANPGKSLVTDVKDDNLRALRLIRDALPDAPNRVIPQIYHPDEFGPVQSMGYRRIILTLYRMSSGKNKLHEAAKAHPYFAVTMPTRKAEALVPALRRAGIPTYVHTINDPAKWEALQELGVSEIYTDWLCASC